VSRESTDKDVKQAYRRLALQHHPDKQPDDPLASQRFTRIAEAYEALKDVEGRRRYAAGGSRSSNRLFKYEDAQSMFQQDFGERIWRDWHEGVKVEGVLIKGGKKYMMTIFPDGTVQEKEEVNPVFAEKQQLFHARRIDDWW
jgi:curved DNA-binding protein CbpA